MPYLKIQNKIIKTPLIDIIKDIKNQIFNGKLKSIKVAGQDIRVTCPFHAYGCEKHPSSSVYIGEPKQNLPYGWFRCFTCNESGPFHHFVAECFNKSDKWAQEWLINNYADEYQEEQIDLPQIELYQNNNTKKELLNESEIDKMESFHPYMLTRKLDLRIRELFKIKYDSITQCIVFPVYDEKGDLVMCTRRSVNSKKFIIDKDKEKPLYLLHYILKNNIKEVMITEGQIDALTACGYGFPCIATMGSPSDHQIKLLNTSGIRVLYTMFDNDEAGKRFTNKIMSKLRKDIIVINVVIPYKNKKDINDLTFEEFYNCVELAENKL